MKRIESMTGLIISDVWKNVLAKGKKNHCCKNRSYGIQMYPLNKDYFMSLVILDY